MMISSHVQKGIDEASHMLEIALKPGIGSTLREIRLSKAFELIRETECFCTAQNDLGHVKRRTLVMQCMVVDIIYRSKWEKREHPELFRRVEELLATWAWLDTRSQYLQSFHIDLFRQCMSDLVQKNRYTDKGQDILRGLQPKLYEACRICKDPFVMSLRREVTRLILEDCYWQAMAKMKAGKWEVAMSLFASKEAELNVFVELEKKLKKITDDRFVSWGLHEGFGLARILRKDFETQLAICKSSQLVRTGDIILKDALGGPEKDMLGKGLLAQDDYRAALNIAMGQDIELEGSILVRLARFHAKITKIPLTAHKLYLRAVQLAAALHPRLPKGAWYRESVDAVQAYRNALQAEETRQRAKKNKPVLERIAKELHKLMGAKDLGDAEFIKFVFKTWPPKTEGGLGTPLDPDDPTNVSKKHFLKAIQRYHTDKNSGWGEEWRVLSEEIAKGITARYNIMKGMW